MLPYNQTSFPQQLLQRIYKYYLFMSIYSGFPTRKDQEKYNSLLTKLINTLQSHLIELIGEVIPQQKIKNYSKIIIKMREYEQHKYLPPKFSDLLTPLAKILGLQAAIQQKIPTNEPDVEQRLKGYKQSSRLIHKHKFNPNYQSYNGKQRRNQVFQQKRQHTQGNLMKVPLFQSSSSKLSKPKVSKAIFPPQQRKIETSQQYESRSQAPQYWQTFNKLKMSKQGLGLASKINNNFRYKAYQALQQAQNNINKRNVPLRQQMRRKLKTQEQPK